jgi:hypothetical protein
LRRHDAGQRGDLLAAPERQLVGKRRMDSASVAKASATARMSRLSMAARMDDPADTLAIMAIGSAAYMLR